MPKFNLNTHQLRTNFWQELIGNRENFPLESRIFHSISVAIIILLTIYVPYNLFAGLYVASASALIIGLFFSHQYYYSRYHGRAYNNIIFGLIGVIILGFNYFTNSGINGSTDVIWPAYLLFVFAITPYRQHLPWLIIYLLSFIIIHVIEFQYPHLIKHPFLPGDGQFIDRITAFPIPVISIYIILTFIRRSYDKEKKVTEEKTMAVELLMSILSHDLRTPLMNVQNYLALLNENEVSLEDRSILEKSLLKSTDNAMEMLSNLLHWSKSQMTGFSVNLQHTNLLNSLLSTLEIEKTQALKKQITLTYHIPDNFMVIADIDMLQIVVRNLISNAVKFTPQGGKITIDAQLVENECKLTVSDNGKGISSDKQKDIFSINSGASYGTNNEKGVGLGLVLCKEFIEHQGGRINFQSNLEEGSSFFIFLSVSAAH